MGCCLSTTASNKAHKSNPDVSPPNRRQHLPESDANGRAPPLLPPPPPPLEEETVKEVLSETPIPKPLIPILNDEEKKRNQLQPVVEEVKIEPTAVINPTEEIISEVSEVSEMCSFSESLSTVTEMREDDGEVTQRVPRSPSKVPRRRPCYGDVARGKERGVRSPTRRSEPSPVKRTHVATRSVPGRTMTTTTTTTTTSTSAAGRRNVGPQNPIRRDAGECSSRRSRSPVTRSEVGARRPLRYKSPTLTPTGRSRGLPPAATAQNGGQREKANDNVLPETTESLENPLVSMECFIFL